MATKKFTTISPLKTIFTLLVLACMCVQAKAFSWTWEANSSGGKYEYNQGLNVSSNGEFAHWQATDAQDPENPSGFQYSTTDEVTNYYFNTGDYTYWMVISPDAFNTVGTKELRITFSINYADANSESTYKFMLPLTEEGVEWTNISDPVSCTSTGTYSYTIPASYADDIKRYGLAIGGHYINWNSVSIIELSGDSEIPLTSGAYEIVNWYTNPLEIRRNDVEVGQTLRVYCKTRATGTNNVYPTDDSYAFFKKDPLTHTPIMSGSDKFSIAGWEYFEIKINSELKNIINNVGLLIGGNNYIIDRVVVYGSGTAEDWTDGAAINTYSYYHETGSWESLYIPGDFFQYIYDGGNKTTTTFNNTKNNIIRVNYNTGGTNKQISVSDTKSQDSRQAYYTRYRKQNDDKETYQYQEYIDLDDNSDHYDFEMSDAITIFNTSVSPKTVVTGAEGVMKGMLSNVTQNGMSVNGNNLTITSVQILPSRVSRYVSGKAVYVHPFSKDQWRPMSLPYNLSNADFVNAFIEKGSNVKYCHLGGADAVKKQFMNGDLKETDYFLKMHFVTANEIRCNYPYIVKLEDEAPSDNTYTFNVKADVRDFQTYTFRTGALKYVYEGNGEDWNEDWTDSDKTNYAPTTSYMDFVSTAPVFDIRNNNQGEVENYYGTGFYTNIAASSGDGDYNYYFYNGTLCPAKTSKNIKSGLAYVQMSGSLHNLIEGRAVVDGQAKSMGFSTALFDIDDDEDITSAIRTAETFDQHVSKAAVGIYNFNGQLISRNAKTSNLPKGMYIINGKKTIIK